MANKNTFISYSHQDDALVNTITQILRTQGNEIFFDKESIKPGEKWSDRIENSIREADQIMVFWCCHSADSDWVVKETLLGMVLQKPIIPILCCDFPVSPAIKEFQWISFKDSLKHSCRGHASHPGQILRDQEEYAGGPSPSPNQSKRNRKAGPSRSWQKGYDKVYATIGIFLALGTVVTYYWLSWGKTYSPDLEINGANAFITYNWPVFALITAITLILILVRRKRKKESSLDVYPELADKDIASMPRNMPRREEMVFNEKKVSEKLEEALRKVGDNPFNFYPGKL